MARTARNVRRTQGILGGRSEGIVRRVLEAAIDELARSGFAGLRIEAVATRAGVNKTTVYRRWPTRPALLRAVVEHLRAPLREQPLPDTGRIDDDLIAAFGRRAAVARGVEGRAWARLLGERHDPALAAIVDAAVAERGAQWRAMVTRAIDRDELPADTEPQLVLDMIRTLVDAHDRDEAWVSAAVRTVIAGARAGTLVRAPVRPRSSRS